MNQKLNQKVQEGNKSSLDEDSGVGGSNPSYRTSSKADIYHFYVGEIECLRRIQSPAIDGDDHYQANPHYLNGVNVRVLYRVVVRPKHVGPPF